MGAALLCAAVGALLLAGCGDDEESPTCEYCEYWQVLVDGFARYPAYSPDANHPERIAFSSKRAAAGGVIDESVYEHVWVLDGTAYHQITDAQYNDFDPSWSPDGTILAFTREMEGRLDVWTVSVENLASPGVPVRLTHQGNVEEGASESSWMEDNGQVWVVFASDGDLYRVPTFGGTPENLVPDPSDVGGDCEFDEVPDYQPAVAADGRVAFTSIGRGEVGTLEVSGYFESAPGETTEVYDAEIYLDDCATGFSTPHTFAFLPVKPDQGTYTVGVESPGHCFRRSRYPFLTANGTVRVRFNFEPLGGDVYLWVYEANCNVYDIFEGDTTYLFRLGTGFPEPADSLIRCLEPGPHTLWLEWNAFDRDTVVTVGAGTLDSVYVFEAKRPSGAFQAIGGGTTLRRSPLQTGNAQIWVADLGDLTMTGFWSLDSSFEQAAWSPDGRYLAFVASDPHRNRWTVKVVDMDSGTAATHTVPLPGSGGSASCNRSAYHVSWNPTGDRLAVSLGNCRGSEGPLDLQIWVIDPGPFLGK